MDTYEEKMIECKQLTLQLLKNEIKIIDLEIEQIKIKKLLKASIKEAEKSKEK